MLFKFALSQLSPIFFSKFGLSWLNANDWPKNWIEPEWVRVDQAQPDCFFQGRKSCQRAPFGTLPALRKRRNCAQIWFSLARLSRAQSTQNNDPRLLASMNCWSRRHYSQDVHFPRSTQKNRGKLCFLAFVVRIGSG